jgi:hypothetical protein
MSNELIEQSTASTELITNDNQSGADYELVRGNIHDLLIQGQDGLKLALQLAKDTESPRSIEVFATLLKTMADTNMQLMEFHSKKSISNTSDNSDQPKVQTNTQNNVNIFTGTTTELSELVSKLQLSPK